MNGFGRKGHGKKHPVDSLKDHKPVPGATGDNIVVIDPVTKLPIKDSGTSLASMLGGIKIIGGWDANTNTPALASSVGVAGNGYIVTVAGNTNLDGITDWKVKDVVWFDGVSSVWRKIDNTEPFHDELSHLLWSLAGHTIDTDLDMAGHKIKNCRHFGDRHVSDILGDDTIGDGTRKNPYKTAQAAFAAGVLAGDTIITLVIDANTLNQYSLSIPSFSPTVSISSPQAMAMTWINFSLIEVADNNSLSIDNITVEKLKEGASSSSTDIRVEESYVKKLLNNAETGHPANWNIVFADSLMNTVAYNNAKAMGARARGNILDYQTGKSCNLTELSMNSKKITDGADPTLPQDFVTKNFSDNNYELSFLKNTAFNKDFGTIAGDVSEGNHQHTIPPGKICLSARSFDLSMANAAARGYLAGFSALLFDDSTEEFVACSFPIPDDIDLSVNPIIRFCVAPIAAQTVGSGCVFRATGRYVAEGESVQKAVDETPEDTVAVSNTAFIKNEGEIELDRTKLAAGDICGVILSRRVSDVGDDRNGDIALFGAMFIYTKTKIGG